MISPSVLDSLRDDGVVATHMPSLRVAAWPFVLCTWVCAVAVGIAGVVDLEVGVRVLAILGVTAGVLAVAGRPATRAWLTPPALRSLEYVTVIAVVGAAVGEPAMPAAFTYLSAIAFHHYEAVYRSQQLGHGPRPTVVWLMGGWEGRVLIVSLLVPMFGSGVVWGLAVWCAAVAVLDSAIVWARERAPMKG